ncbi:MAG: hypothetical protein R3E66_06535 [bacterium]
MKRLLLMVVVLSGCSLFEDVEQVRFRPGFATVDAGADASADAAADAQGDVPDMEADDGMADMSVDMPTTCPEVPCDGTQYCDNGVCKPAGPCRQEGCSRGLICAPSGQCVTCADDVDCGEGATCEGAFCVCNGVQNYCSLPGTRPSACVPSTSLDACGPDCETCPEPPPNADGICGTDGCDFSCKPDFVRRDDQCITAGTTCPNAGGLIGGDCDPIAQTGCPNGFFCTIRSVSANQFERICAFDNPNATATEGDSCVAVACGPGLACFAGTCRRYCDVSNAAGCAPGQFCAPPIAPTPGIGYCHDGCSLN